MRAQNTKTKTRDIVGQQVSLLVACAILYVNKSELVPELT